MFLTRKDWWHDKSFRKSSIDSTPPTREFVRGTKLMWEKIKQRYNRSSSGSGNKKLYKSLIDALAAGAKTSHLVRDLEVSCGHRCRASTISNCCKTMWCQGSFDSEGIIEAYRKNYFFSPLTKKFVFIWIMRVTLWLLQPFSEGNKEIAFSSHDQFLEWLRFSNTNLMKVMEQLGPPQSLQWKKKMTFWMIIAEH